MLFNLSLRNVRRSFRDYAIYFLTLMFAVCLFYSFNAISNQQVFAELSSSKAATVEMLSQMLSSVSIFVSIIIAFLIIYANNFLIKRRKKELGLYMTLGMSKGSISRIFVVETFVIGLFSLVAGLGLGVIISQGLSAITIKMFEVNVSKFAFVFSTDAFWKTILYFSIIFMIVVLFNTISISRHQLIDLLTASRKNEMLKVRKKSISIVLLMVSIFLIVGAYIVIWKVGLLEDKEVLLGCIFFGSVGTLLFFASLSSVVLQWIQEKEMYYHHINMFVLRQINSKINTTFVSMGIICLMLFFTIGVLSTGFSLKESFQKDLDLSTPYDASLYHYYDEGDPQISLIKTMEKLNIDSSAFKEIHEFSLYNSNLTADELKLRKYASKNMENQLNYFRLSVLKRSDYERLVKMQGKQPLHLEENEVLMISNMQEFKQIWNKFLKENATITLGNKDYVFAENSVEEITLYTEMSAIERGVIVVPDGVEKNFLMDMAVANINYDNKKKNDEIIFSKLKENMENPKEDVPFLLGLTRTAAYDESVGASTTIVFVGIYLGVVFLISSAAILALQQLSEVSDNIERYNILKKIGVPKNYMNKAIFRQVGIYFILPLTLAIIHSIIGIGVVNDALIGIGKANVLLPSLITGGIIIIVYGGYFFATYVGCKNIIK